MPIQAKWYTPLTGAVKTPELISIPYAIEKQCKGIGPFCHVVPSVVFVWAAKETRLAAEADTCCIRYYQS